MLECEGSDAEYEIRRTDNTYDEPLEDPLEQTVTADHTDFEFDDDDAIRPAAETTGLTEILDRAEPVNEAAVDELTYAATLAPEHMFDRTDTRVPPQAMGGFILDGLTEGDVIDIGRAAGYEPPIMDLTRVDVDTCLPHIGDVSDNLSLLVSSKVTIAFADRDAQSLYDDFAIAHANGRGILIPASMGMLESESMADPELARDFLERYGIDETWFEGGEVTVVADTGHMGSVASGLAIVAANALEADYRDLARTMPGVLVCSLNSRIPEVSFISEDPKTLSSRLPKLSQVVNVTDPWLLARTPASWYVATALQVMPRHHGHYNGIERRADGRVYATIADEPICNNVDESAFGNAAGNRAKPNSSPVNPVAAAIVQMQIVRNALRRTGQMDRWV